MGIEILTAIAALFAGFDAVSCAAHSPLADRLVCEFMNALCNAFEEEI